MIKLVIKNADGSHYWTEHFNDQASADAWLAEEKTRPYWDAKRTCEFILIPTYEPTEQEKTRAEAIRYLASTDWYVIREMDSGVPMPEDIKIKRQQAREVI